MDIEMLKVMESLLDEKLEPIKENINSLKSEINSIKMNIQSLLEFQCNTNTSSSADSYRFTDNHINKRPPKPSVEAIWLEAKQVMKKELTEVSYQTWINPIIPIKLEKNIIFLETGSLFSKDIIETRYLDLIKTAIFYVASQKYDVKVVVVNSIENQAKSTLNKLDNNLTTSVFNPPEEINIQNDRLTSIFEIDGVFELGELELDDKLSILKNKACERDINISDEILAAIVENENYNVRELINVLNRLKAYIDISGNPIDMKLIKDIIEERFK